MKNRVINLVVVTTIAICMVGCGSKASVGSKIKSETAQDAADIVKSDDVTTIANSDASDKTKGEIKSLKDIDADSQSSVASAGNMTFADAAAVGVAYPARANFVNSTNRNVYSIYIAGVTDHNWGADLMGDMMIPAGTYDTIYFYAYGGNTMYDILVMFDDGTSLTYTDCDFTGKSLAGFDIYLEMSGSDYIISY